MFGAGAFGWLAPGQTFHEVPETTAVAMATRRVPADGRTLTVPVAGRALAVADETPTVAAVDEARVFTVGADTRTKA